MICWKLSLTYSEHNEAEWSYKDIKHLLLEELKLSSICEAIQFNLPMDDNNWRPAEGLMAPGFPQGQ
ncbi:hypothetical protein ACH5RR_001039 [Cinchona calisaya]|uniref:Uncharacterized protein n=1 Tax=Cinchona calisaya TaxID=153742 RepID=A0ABD3B2X8_9GENT